jgi:predicted lipoprotein with Yx(FWY)xxD motif
MLRFSVIAAAVLLSSSLALAHESESAAPPPKKPDGPPARVALTEHGALLVDLNGMTLYYFDRDDSGRKSACNDACVQRWAPLAAPDDAQPDGDFTVIVRNDGSKMWAYRYRPLYTSHADKAPGEVNGADQSAPLWHVARPAY